MSHVFTHTERIVAYLAINARGVFTKTKLLKMLYFADFDAYEVDARPLTDLKYVALPYGPVPDQYSGLLRRWATIGVLLIAGNGYSVGPQAQSAAAQLDIQTVTHLDWVIARRGRLLATRLVQDTHADRPWQAVWRGISGEPISFEAASLRGEQLHQLSAEALEAVETLDQAAAQRRITIEMATAGRNLIADFSGFGEVVATILDDEGVSIDVEDDERRELAIFLRHQRRRSGRCVSAYAAGTPLAWLVTSNEHRAMRN